MKNANAILKKAAVVLMVSLPIAGMAQAHPTGLPGHTLEKLRTERSSLRVPKPAETQSRWVANYGKLPLGFEPNEGQMPGAVKFLSRGLGYTLLLSSNEAISPCRSQRSEVKGKLFTVC